MNLFEEANQANVEIVNERQRFQADKDKEKEQDKEKDKEKDKERDREREEDNKLNYYYYSSSNSTDQFYVDNSALILNGKSIPLEEPKKDPADFSAGSGVCFICPVLLLRRLWCVRVLDC